MYSMNMDDSPVGDLWGDFEQGLDPLHHAFIARLTTLYPSLSRAEIRICSMIKLGLNTHEIATLLHMSERSVESCRQSLRKKLLLKKGEEIKSFLETIYRDDPGDIPGQSPLS
jgi:DNA-binding NarL/FixJ family response regulator